MQTKIKIGIGIAAIAVLAAIFVGNQKLFKGNLFVFRPMPKISYTLPQSSSPPANASLPTATLKATPNAVPIGGPATLTWNTTGATEVVLKLGNIDISKISMPDQSIIFGDNLKLGLQGSLTVSPNVTENYILRITGKGGTISRHVTVTVYLKPTAMLTATPNAVLTGDPVNLTWSTTEATDIVLIEKTENNTSVTNQSVGQNGSLVVNPATTKIYTLKATGGGGTVTQEVTVTVRKRGGVSKKK